MKRDFDNTTIRRLRDVLVNNGKLINKQADNLPQDGLDSTERQQASIKRVSPFAETMFLVMMADGSADQSERDAIQGALQLLTHGFIDQTQLAELITRFEQDIDNHGVESRLQSLGAQLSADRQDRETAFTLAAAIAVADEKVEQQENALIDSIAEWYGISGVRRRAILQQVDGR